MIKLKQIYQIKGYECISIVLKMLLLLIVSYFKLIFRIIRLYSMI
eukprot:UN08365